MTASQNPNSPAAARRLERELTLTRLLNAPRPLVWAAWTEAKHLARWWGPAGFTNPVCEVDARPGGALRIVMRAPDGAEHPMTGVFREVVALERLVFAITATDQTGSALLEGFTTVTFAAEGAKTRLTVETRAVGLVPYAARMLDGMEAGWSQSLDRLRDLLATH